MPVYILDALGNGGVEVPTKIGEISTGYAAPQIAGTSKMSNSISGSTYNLTTIDFFPTLAWMDIPLPVKGIALYFLYLSYVQIYMILPFDEPLKINQWDGLKYLPGDFKIAVD
jgi:hypothetical protein